MVLFVLLLAKVLEPFACNLDGAFLFWQGRKELQALATIKKQKAILNMIRRQGHVEISKIVSDLDLSNV